MPRWVKSVIGVVLLPFCWGAVVALLKVLRATGSADTFWVAFLGGAACWLVVFLLLPKPMRLYVLGHELTHALWTWLCLGKVKRFKIGVRGGHVVVNRKNFLVVLAPYFFPVYAVLLVTVFLLGRVLFGWPGQSAWFHLLLGAAYAFHLTLTWHILHARQSDIASQGWLFSAVIIFLGNIAVLLVGLPLLTARVSVLTSMAWWLDETARLLHRLRLLL